VYRGPYEYSSPESEDDYLPQDMPPERLRQPVKTASESAEPAETV
jgi:hypothetical protein